MLNFVVGIEGWLWYGISFTILSTSVAVFRKVNVQSLKCKIMSALVNLEDKKWTEQNVNEHISGLVLMGEVDTGT